MAYYTTLVQGQASDVTCAAAPEALDLEGRYNRQGCGCLASASDTIVHLFSHIAWKPRVRFDQNSLFHSCVQSHIASMRVSCLNCLFSVPVTEGEPSRPLNFRSAFPAEPAFCWPPFLTPKPHSPYHPHHPGGQNLEALRQKQMPSVTSSVSYHTCDPCNEYILNCDHFIQHFILLLLLSAFGIAVVLVK